MATGCDHCPFLNRADSRCSRNFRLDCLGHAYRHCFGQFKLCTTYIELLVERRVRHITAANEHGDGYSDIPIAARHAQHAAAR